MLNPGKQETERLFVLRIPEQEMTARFEQIRSKVDNPTLEEFSCLNIGLILGLKRYSELLWVYREISITPNLIAQIEH